MLTVRIGSVALVVALTACGGSPKPKASDRLATEPTGDPPKGPGGDDPRPQRQNPDPPAPEECDKAIDHTFDLMERSNETTADEKQKLKSLRAQPGVRETPEWAQVRGECMQIMSKRDIACVLNATDLAGIRRCGEPGGTKP